MTGHTLQPVVTNPCWATLDNFIRALADKLRGLGYKETLEVEFRIWSTLGVDPEAFRGFLLKFREKGPVKIVPRRSFHGY
jgi:hypothetical protein